MSTRFNPSDGFSASQSARRRRLPARQRGRFNPSDGFSASQRARRACGDRVSFCFNPSDGFSASQRTSAAGRLSRPCAGFNPSDGFSASQSSSRTPQCGQQSRAVSIRRTDSPLPKGPVAVMAAALVEVSIRRTDSPLPKAPTSPRACRRSCSFQSVGRILRFPKCGLAPGARSRRTRFNPSDGFSASQSTVPISPLTSGVCVSIRRTDSPLPKAPPRRRLPTSWPPRFQSVGRILRFPKHGDAERGDGKRRGFNPSDGFSASQSRMLSPLLSGLRPRFQSVGRILRFPKRCCGLIFGSVQAVSIRRTDSPLPKGLAAAGRVAPCAVSIRRTDSPLPKAHSGALCREHDHVSIRRTDSPLPKEARRRRSC